MPKWRLAVALDKSFNFQDARKEVDEIFLKLTGKRYADGCSKKECQYKKKYAYIQQHLNTLGLLS